MKKTIFILAVSSLFIISCKKDHNEPQDITPTVQNVSGSYTIAKLTMQSTGTPEQDVTTSFLTSCERDDIYKLNADMSYDYMDAGTACSPDGSFSSNWDLPSATTITIDAQTATILKFNGTNLNVSYDMGSGSSMIFYLVKQ